MLGYHTLWKDLNLVSALNTFLVGYDLRYATASHALAPPRGRLDVYSAD